VRWKDDFVAIAAILLFACAGHPARAQIALPGPGLPSLPAGVTDRLPLDSTIGSLGQNLDGTLAAPSRLRGLIRQSRGALQPDPFGWPVVSGEIVAIGLSAPARDQALRDGFNILREEQMASLDLSALVLAPPRRLSLSRAANRLSRLDPDADITFNHIHTPAGATIEPRRSIPVAPASSPSAGARLGLIDTGVLANHPAFAGSRIIQRGFAGTPRAAPHGTAVASLLVGQAGVFSGAFPEADLLVADVYGGQATGGSSTGLAQALAWMVEQGVGVVNVSLVGPRNSLVERAVARAQARGVVIVAAVGNDGPAAPPLYPASYEGVVGVAAVSGRNRILPESGRGLQVDFTAPGADMAAAAQGGGWTSVRGASFASPLVAGMIGRSGGSASAVTNLTRSALDLGAPGRDPVYGHGLVGAALRVEPGSVAARGQLAR
jgi:hypothetical protein